MKSDQSNQTKPSSKDSEIEEVNHLDNDKEEQRREPDWQWLEELLSEYNITEKRTGTTPKRDFTGIEARLYREIQKRYRQRKKPDYIKTPTANRSSKQYEDAKRIHGEQVKTMDAMGYGLMLDGFTFYKYGHELEPYDFEQNFQMHQAYEIHSFTQSKLKAFAGELEKAIGEDERIDIQSDFDKLDVPHLETDRYPGLDGVRQASRNILRAKQRKALKAIKEKYQL